MGMIKQFAISLFRSSMRHNIGSLAAIIAFFGFSSLFPVLCLLVYVASFVVPEAVVAQFLQRILQSYIPALPFGGNFARTTLQHLTLYRAHISIVGTFGLLWGSIGGFVNLQQIMDTIYEVRKRRSFILQYVIGFVMMGILLSLTVASSVISALDPASLQRFLSTNVIDVWMSIHLLGIVTFPVVLWVTCYCCYRILPSAPQRPWAPVVGALTATLLIYASRWGFVIYTHYLGNYALMYGSFAFVMLFTFWIYVVCIILLIGAEVSSTINHITMDKQQAVDSDGAVGRNGMLSMWRRRVKS